MSSTADSYKVDFHLKEYEPARNYIKTSKYTLLTFLPLNLYQQFHRYYNLYFLLACFSVIGGYASVSAISMIAPLLIVLGFSAAKEGVEDYNRYKLDQMANKKPAQVVRGGVLTTVDSMDICPGDIVYVQKGEKFPVDCVLLASSYDEGTVFVETAELDGETNLKRRTTCGMKVNADSYNFFAELQGQIECELPNEHLNSFVGRMNVSHPPESAKDFPLSLNNLALRGCVLRNTDWVYALVVYTGADTKIIRNLKPAVFKFSSLQKNLNTTVLCIFIYNAAILIASIVLEYQFYSNAVAVEAQNKINSTDYARDWYLGPRSTDKGIHIVKTLLSFFAMYTYVVPISLFVTMELVRLGQATYMSRDQKMLAKLRSSDGTETELPMRASNSNLNEDLGRVKFIFSDKTGTFTQNLMRMSKWYVGGLILSELDTPGILHDHMSNSAQSDVLRHFALAISLCHGVIPSLDEKTGNLIYESQSPDETALLEAVSANQYSLKKRTKDIMTVEIDGVPKDFEVMNVIEFDSTRKRMSVIVKYDGKIRLYSKGADNIMFERLDKSAKENQKLDDTSNALAEFSRFGLRTLVVAYREISESEYHTFNKAYTEAELALEGRDEKINVVAETVECNLRILGCTAVEDKLQEDLPATIESILQAEINLWLLTGDKTETAINIGLSSNLISKEMELFVLDAEEEMEIIKSKMKENQNKTFALVASGELLKKVLCDESLKKSFLDIGVLCRSVICSRVTPLQKSQVVKMVKDAYPNIITLAIGDGANDVSMIQEAHIGVGIMGREGTQAVRAADYAFGEFRFLKRLVMVHGRYNYLRLSNLILYCFYKNLVFITVQFIYGFTNMWSGQLVYEELFFSTFNMFFTALPPLFYGIYERDLPDSILEKIPKLFIEVRDGLYWNIGKIMYWLAVSLISALLIFLAVYGMNFDGTADLIGRSTGYWVQCYLFSTPMLLVVTFKMATMTRFWIWPIIWGLGISIALNIGVMFLLIVLDSLYVTDYATAVITHALPPYYILCVLMPAACIVPDIAAQYFKSQIKPSDYDIAAEQMALPKRVTVDQESKKIYE